MQHYISYTCSLQTDNIIHQYYCLQLLLCNMFLPRRLSIIVQYFIVLVGPNK